MTSPLVVPGDESFDRMKSKVMTTIAGRSRARTIKHRFAAVGIAVAIAGVTAAAAMLIGAASNDVLNSSVHCYGTTEYTAGPGSEQLAPVTMAYMASGDENVELLPLDDRIAQAESLCGLAWSTGAFTTERGYSATEANEIPPLTVCQEADKNLAVFPNTRSAENLCRELGLITPRS